MILTLKELRTLPKVELHRHIEGSMRVETLRELAAKKNLDRYPYRDPNTFRNVVSMSRNDTPDFLRFLSKFINVWYSSLDDVERIGYESVVDVYNEGVIYYELRFSPEHYAVENDYAREKVVARLIRGAQRAMKELKGIEVRFIFTLNRMKQKPKDMEYLIDIAKEFHTEGVAGLDLAGDEINYPARDFTNVFKKVKEAGLFGITIHAGEVVPPSSIWDSITYLYADRIGHGVTSIQDEKLIDYLIEHDITLEQCFNSNLQTAAIADIQKHPFPELYKKGVNVTICTDDPTVQQTDLNDDYYIANKIFEFSFDDFKKVNLTALDAAYLPEEKKGFLKKRYVHLFEKAQKAIEAKAMNATHAE